MKNKPSIDYLRVAITDRCDFRCIYCMPPQGILHKRREDVLSLEEIVAFVRVAAANGIRRVRLTGGEPLVRKDCVDLVKQLLQIDGINEISLTTNGSRLENLAAPLKNAGLSRVNVSLDSVEPDRFRIITRGGDLDATLRGIVAAWLAGLTPVKLNVVILPGLEEELDKFVSLAVKFPFHIRFIEQMNVGAWRTEYRRQFIPYVRIKRKLEQMGRLKSTNGPTGSGPAKYYRFPASRGSIGFISAVTHGACASCSRLRLTADGKIKTCLFSSSELNVRDALKSGDLAAMEVIDRAMTKKSLHLQGKTNPVLTNRAMCQIGG